MPLMPLDLVRQLVELARDDVRWEDPAEVQATVGRMHQVLQSMDAALLAATGQPAAVAAAAEDPTPEQAQARLEALSAWLESCQPAAQAAVAATAAAYKFEAHPDVTKGNSVVALKDIDAGEVVMTIPRNALLSAKFGQGPHPSIAATVLPHFADNSVLELAIVVAFHKHHQKTSYFRPFLDILPSEFTLPQYWSCDIFRLFQLTPTACRAAKSFRAAATLYFRAFSTLEQLNIDSFPPSALTWKVFSWALSVVLTRQNHVPLPVDPALPASVETMAAESVAALVPGWDMMNHTPGEMTTFYDQDKDCLVFPAPNKLKAREEICMCYGYRQNELFLLYSGFCVRDSPFDAMDLPIPLVQDEIKKIRECLVRTIVKPGSPVELLEERGIATVPIRYDDNGILQPAAWFCALAAVVDRAEAAQVLRSRITDYHALLASPSVSISEETKTKTKQLLNKALTDHLHALETTERLFDDHQQQQVQGEPEAASFSPPLGAATQKAVIESCKNLVAGHISLARKALAATFVE